VKNVGWSVACLLLAACGDSTPSSPNEAAASANPDDKRSGASPASSKRLICPQCTQNVGGETSDFGDNSALVLGGSAIHVEPTPCQRNEQRSGIDEGTARARGFGAVLDRLATSFDQPLAWTPQELGAGMPATGYALQTRVRGSLQVTAIEQVTHTLEGCGESLRVGLAVTLETVDGALSIAGQVGAEVQRDSEVLAVDGLLDLSAALGTLEISPPPTEEAMAGYVMLFLYLWPEEVRASLRISAFELRDIGSDSPHFIYDPLEGRAPVDACDISAKPIALDKLLVETNGNSLAATFPEIQTLVSNAQPFAASWTSGAMTSLQVELGQPFQVCDIQDGRVEYKLPFGLRSSDGRVNIQRDAKGYLAYQDGQWRNGWMELYPSYYDSDSNAFETADTFALATGISGVDFGDVGGGIWHAQLSLARTAPALRGDLTVEGIDTDGHITGIKGGVVREPIERLLW
jgi:hypothetical protein